MTDYSDICERQCRVFDTLYSCDDRRVENLTSNRRHRVDQVNIVNVETQSAQKCLRWCLIKVHILKVYLELYSICNEEKTDKPGKR